MLYKFKIYFKVDDVDCEFELNANGYDEVKERFFEELKADRLNGLYIKTVDTPKANEIIEKIRKIDIPRENILKTQKIDN